MKIEIIKLMEVNGEALYRVGQVFKSGLVLTVAAALSYKAALFTADMLALEMRAKGRPAVEVVA